MVPPAPEVKVSKRTGLPLKPRGFAAKSHPFHGRAAEAGKRGAERFKNIARKGLDLSTIEALRAGAETLTDAQWNEVKNRVLLATVTDPVPNAAASLKAIEAMDRQRDRAKYGTKDAVMETLRKCEERMAELDRIEAIAQGAGGGVLNAGETTGTGGE